MATITEEYVGTVRVAILKHADMTRLDLRFYYGDIPERGINIRASYLPDLIAALRSAENHVRRLGLLNETGGEGNGERGAGGDS